MVNPHLDNGVPWSPSPPQSTPQPVNPVNPNFGNNQNNNQVSPGNPGNTYDPNLNPVVTPPVDDNTTNHIGGSLHGDQEFVPEYPGLGEEGGTTYDMIDVMQGLANTHGALKNPDGTPTKYGLSFDGKQGNLNSGHTLGSFIAVDSSGNPILDSQGKPIFTSLGKFVHDDLQNKGFVGSNQYIDPSMMPELKGIIEGFSFEDLHNYENDFWRNYTAPGGEGGYEEDMGSMIDDRNAWKERLFYGPKIAPQRAMKQSGFMDTMTNPYLKDMAETLEGGLYGKSIFGMGMNPVGLEKKYATGRSRGGIMAIWNDRK